MTTPNAEKGGHFETISKVRKRLKLPALVCVATAGIGGSVVGIFGNLIAGRPVLVAISAALLLVNLILWGLNFQLWRRTWDSQRQQPTSGSSPSPVPSSSPSGSPSENELRRSLLGLYPSENPRVFPPETRRETPVIGYRMWSVREGFKLGIGKQIELRSMNEGYGAWTSDINTAVCHALTYSIGPSYGPVPVHDVPDATCHCGFYVLSSLDSVPLGEHSHQPREETQMTYPASFSTTKFAVSQERKVTVYPQVAGVVVGWGRVIQHGSEGWRAQYAKIVALLDCKISPEHLEMTRGVAELFHVPVLTRPALEMLAREYGDPLPTEALALR